MMLDVVKQVDLGNNRLPSPVLARPGKPEAVGAIFVIPHRRRFTFMAGFTQEMDNSPRKGYVDLFASY